MTRCLVVEQMVHAGFTISTIAFILNRTVQAIRHLLKMSNDYYESSRAFRLSTSEATLLNKDVDPQYRSRNPYDDEERYHEREEYGHRERGRYGRY